MESAAAAAVAVVSRASKAGRGTSGESSSKGRAPRQPVARVVELKHGGRVYLSGYYDVIKFGSIMIDLKQRNDQEIIFLVT